VVLEGDIVILTQVVVTLINNIPNNIPFNNNNPSVSSFNNNTIKK